MPFGTSGKLETKEDKKTKKKKSAVKSKFAPKTRLCKYHTCDTSIAHAMGL